MGNEITTQKITLPQMLKSNNVNARFKTILGEGAASFISSILTIYNENSKLRQCDPMSILAAAGQAANLKLPIMPQLGYAYVIPYGNVAQFQLGYKGLIQLAMRSGKFRHLNSSEIYEGQIKQFNPITGVIELGEKTSDKIVGYAAYMELLNGFSKTLYMSREDVERHAQKFSPHYRNSQSVWSKNFDTMAKKTVMKKLLSTYAPTSIEMKSNALMNAIQADQPAQFDGNKVDDVGTFETIDIETGEVINGADNQS